MGGCAKGCLKNVLFAANLLLMLCGVAVIAVGAWSVVDTEFLPHMFSGKSFTTSAYVIIAMGVLIVIITFLGCCGAVNENRCMLITYFIALLLIFILMFAAAVLLFVFKDKVDQQLRVDVKASASKYGEKEAITEAWDITQKKLQCCGVSDGDNSSDSYGIWADNKHLQDEEKVVPDSCCKDVSTQEAITTCQSDPKTNVYNEDCVDKLEGLIKKHSMLLGGIGIAVACLLIVGMILACSLVAVIRHRRRGRVTVQN